MSRTLSSEHLSSDRLLVTEELVAGISDLHDMKALYR